MSQATVIRLSITPNCQQAHGGLSPALMEAMRRAIPECQKVAEFECNKDANFDVTIKVTRPEVPNQS